MTGLGAQYLGLILGKPSFKQHRLVDDPATFGRTNQVEEALMDMLTPETKLKHWIVRGLTLAALLTGPLVTATFASPWSRDHVTVAKTASVDTPRPRCSPTSQARPCDIGAFFFGYVEFDVDPANGVPGFDSMPPGVSP
jgi:hypothetical protein